MSAAINRLGILLAILIAFTHATSAAQAADPFTGKWKVVVTPEEDGGGNGKAFKETLEFKGDQFTAETFNKAHGFESITYEGDTRRGPTASFTAEAKDQEKADGIAKWTGFTTGSEIQGELVWTKKDGTEVRYTFKGSKS